MSSILFLAPSLALLASCVESALWGLGPATFGPLFPGVGGGCRGQHSRHDDRPALCSNWSIPTDYLTSVSGWDEMGGGGADHHRFLPAPRWVGDPQQQQSAVVCPIAGFALGIRGLPLALMWHPIGAAGEIPMSASSRPRPIYGMDQFEAGGQPGDGR